MQAFARNGTVSLRETTLNPPSALEGSERTYRPVDLARAIGLSASQIRNYERFGFLPPADRTASGYRVYTNRHLEALRAARTIQRGYGWQRARDAMAAVHSGDHAAALAVADERHADLHGQRAQVAQALKALASAQRDVGVVLGLRVPRGHTISIGQAAGALGVNASALRYWESRGVIQSDRSPSGRRRFDNRQLQQLQLVKLLRDVNYRFDTIKTVVDNLTEPTGTRATQALEQRQQRIDKASTDTAAATRTLLDYIESQPATRP
jgi:DNA-binding transcriptional MerR regulator